MPVVAAICGAIATGLMYWLVWGRGVEYIDYRWRIAAAARRDAKLRSVSQERRRMAALRSIQDSRDAATALMIAVAQQRGEITPEQMKAIEQEMRSVLGLSNDVACRFSFARFAVEQAAGFEDAVSTLVPLLRRNLTLPEQEDLLGILNRVATVHNGPTAKQVVAIQATRTALASTA